MKTKTKTLTETYLEHNLYRTLSFAKQNFLYTNMNPYITSLIDYGVYQGHYDGIDDAIIYVADIPQVDTPFMAFTHEIDSNIFISQLVHYNIQSITNMVGEVNNIANERKAAKICEEGFRILKSIRPSIKIVKSIVKKNRGILKNPPPIVIEKHKVDMGFIKNRLIKIHPYYINIVNKLSK